MEKQRKVFIKSGMIICVIALAFAFTCLKPAKVSAAKIGKVKTIKVISTAKSTDKKATITVSWSKAKGAKKYIVYRATAKNGKYKKIKTVKKTTFTDKKKAGLFYYKVRPINGKKKGKFSAKKGTYTVSGRFMFAMTTTTMFSSWRMHHIEVNDLANKNLYVQQGTSKNMIILTEEGTKKIAEAKEGTLVLDDEKAPYKIPKDDHDVGMRSALYSTDGKDLYALYTVSNDAKGKTTFLVWINLSKNETYVEQGSDYTKSVIFSK